MEIGIRVEAEKFETGEKRHIISAYFTFIALDENKKPTEVPSVTPETSIEKRRYEEAGDRRQRRIKDAELRNKKRASELK